MSKFDLLLQRITSISQIALVVIAIFTIWYSVIPLYQKELASEQLAKIQLDQIKAEERVEFLNSSYAMQLQEIDSARTEISDLTNKLASDKTRLEALSIEIEQKNNQLSALNFSLNRTKKEAVAASSQLTQSQRLKFIQALEWYTIIAPLGERCDQGLRRWRADSVKIDEAKKTGCDPYENIKSAISSIQNPDAKDSSGDPLNIDRGKIKAWSKKAALLMEMNKYQLSDRMDYTHHERLLKESEGFDVVDRSGKDSVEVIERRMQAGKKLLSYEHQSRIKNREVVEWYIELLRVEL